MHERRNAILAVLFAICLAWAVVAWLAVAAIPVIREYLPVSVNFHRYASLGLALVLAAFLFYTLRIKDRLDDEISKVTMGVYYEQDGLCFMPMLRVTQTRSNRLQAELSVYYQNRFEGACEAVIHLRPPPGSLFSHRGANDIHFAFQAMPGAFGVIHQPVAVPHPFQGQTVPIQVAAAVRWPRGRGAGTLRSHAGRPCGTFNVDWAQAYRQSRHELCGEIELHNPVTLHLTLPTGVREDIERAEFRNETLKKVDTGAVVAAG